MKQSLSCLRIAESLGADGRFRHRASAAVRRWRTRGQALPFTLAFGAATTLVALVLFNNGMLANAKTRLQNAADAGAYSAAVLQARDHNFSALTNRAIVANQAAVAQIVSMKSYLEDAVDTRDRMDGILLAPQAALHAISKPLWDQGKNIPIKATANAFNNAAPWAVQGLDGLIRGYEAAQEAHHLATAAEMVFVADEVVKRNDPNASVSGGTFTAGRTTFQVGQWKDYTQQHRANDTSAAADRFADQVVSNKTTDHFTRFRPSSPFPRWYKAESLACRLVFPTTVKTSSFFDFAHTGGTQLSKDKRTWVAMDVTMGFGGSFCTYWSMCGWVPCLQTGFIPIIDVGGSGGGRAGKGGYEWNGGYKNNPGSTLLYGGAMPLPPGLVRYAKGPGDSLDDDGGLQNNYRDLKHYNQKPANQSAELNSSNAVTIEVERKEATVRTSSKILPNSQQLALEDATKGDTLRALSSAQSYFYRSTSNSGFTKNGWKRADNKTEMANLFSPYWQTRLVDRSLADRAASWAAQ